MSHYICTGGCHGYSTKPATCNQPTCPHYQQALEECDCTDGRHFGEFDTRHHHDESLPIQTDKEA